MTEFELQERFLSEYEENIFKEVYEVSDINKVREDLQFVDLYMKHNKRDLDKSLKFMHTSLEWRKSFGIKELTSSSFPATFLSQNMVFFCNKDKNGHRILHIQFSKMKKDSIFTENARKFLVWQIEKAFQANMGHRIVVLMDMSGAGLNNVEMNFVKFLISCFTTYYPYMLEYLLVVELPWILNAFWSVVKGWLTAEQQKFVTVVKKNGLTNFVDSDQLFTHLGGGCEVPTFQVHSPTETREAPFLTIESSTEEGFVSCPSPPPYRRSVLQNQVSQDSSVSTSLPTSCLETPVVEDQMKSTVDHVSLSPPECIVFDTTNQTGDFVTSTITLNNPTSYRVAFKIKTTSTELFRVRPVKGIILSQGQQRISVSLSQGKQCNNSKDKFLVMLMMVRDDSVKDEESIAKLWKSMSKNTEDFMEHKLSCKVIVNQHSEVLVPNGIIQTNKQVSSEEVMEHLRQINRNQMVITILLIAILFKIILCPNWLI